MHPNARHYLRPFQLPAYDKISAEEEAIQSQAPVCLPDLTKSRFSEAKKAVAEFAKSCLSAPKPGSDVIITPLGTSSACPTKFRNGRFVKCCV
jgi:ribonuclease Z